MPRWAADYCDYILVTAGMAVTTAVIWITRFWHEHVHGVCNCAPGKLIEYIPASILLLVVIVMASRMLVQRNRERNMEVVRRREAEQDLLAAQNTITRLVEFNDLQLATLDLRRMGRQLSIDSMMELIQIGSEQINLNEPEHGMLAFIEPDGTLRGNLYSRAEGRDVLVKTGIRIPTADSQAITEGQDDVRSSSYETEGVSLDEYQQRFHSEVRAVTGIIRNYMTYRIPGSPGGAMVLFNFKTQPRESDKLVLKAMVFSLGSMSTLQDQLEKRRNAQLSAMAKLAELAESRDPETGEHLQRIAHFSRLLAEMLMSRGMHPEIVDEDFVEDIFHSSPLHDIGKVGIEDAILRKPGKLSAEEYDIMKTHAVIGGKVLEGVEFMEMARDIAFHHHEKWDGSGYPNGRKGSEIPLAARIVAIVDVYDALTSKRVYKEAYSRSKTEQIMREGGGKHFDPELLEVFLELEDKLVEIREKYAERDESLISRPAS